MPDGSHVDEDELGLVVSHPTLGTWRHEAVPLCSEERYAPRPSMHMYRETGYKAVAPAVPVAAPPMNKSVAHCDIPPCTCDALPCNNWCVSQQYKRVLEYLSRYGIR